jgi:hypothetical protein
MNPQMGLDTKTDWLTDWLTDRQSQCDFDFNFDWKLSGVENSDQEVPVVQRIWERVLTLENWVEEDFTVIWSASFFVEIRCQKTTSGNGQFLCMCKGEVESV